MTTLSDGTAWPEGHDTVLRNIGRMIALGVPEGCPFIFLAADSRGEIKVISNEEALGVVNILVDAARGMIDEAKRPRGTR